MADFDYSKFTDEELALLASQDGSKPKTDNTAKFDYSQMTDDELRALAFQDLNGPKPEPPESFGKGLLRGSIEALPMAGSLIGGVIGGSAGLASPIPGGAAMGAIGGSGLGAAAGSSLAQTAKSIFFDEKPQSRGEQLQEVGLQGLGGITSEMGGQIVGPALTFGKSLFTRTPSKAIASAEALGKQMATGDASAKAVGTIENKIGPSSAEVSGQLFEKVQPKTLEELRAWNPPEGAGKLQSLDRLKEIQTIVPDLEIKPLGYHFKQLENPKAMKDLKIQFENLPVDDAKKIASYNQAMVDESKNKITDTVKNITGQLPKDLSEEGSDFIEKIKSQYGKEKDVLGPVFEKIQKSKPLNKMEVSDLKVAIIQNSKLAPLLNITPEGEISLLANRPRTGISQQEYGPLKEVIDDLSGKVSFKEIQNIRDFLRKNIDYANPKSTQEIEKVRSLLLDQLESIASAKAPQMRDTFRRYAINEKAKANIEKIIGGQLENIDSMYNANPDKIVNRILSNPNYTEVVRQYAGDDAIKNMVSSYVNNGYEKSLDNVKGFLPHTFRSFLNKNEKIITNNLGSKTFDRLSALTDNAYLGKRFLDEVNPSGTAASLAAMLEPKSFISKIKNEGIMSAITSEAISKATSKVKQRQAVNALSKVLGEGSVIYKPPPSNESPIRDTLMKMTLKHQTDTTKDSALQRRMNQMNNQQGGQ